MLILKKWLTLRTDFYNTASLVVNTNPEEVSLVKHDVMDQIKSTEVVQYTVDTLAGLEGLHTPHVLFTHIVPCVGLFRSQV